MTKSILEETLVWIKLYMHVQLVEVTEDLITANCFIIQKSEAKLKPLCHSS